MFNALKIHIAFGGRACFIEATVLRFSSHKFTIIQKKHQDLKITSVRSFVDYASSGLFLVKATSNLAGYAIPRMSK